MSKQQVHTNALFTFDNRYPEDSWLYVFTDGSLFDDKDGAGTGLHCELLSCYALIKAHSMHYDGEIEAI